MSETVISRGKLIYVNTFDTTGLLESFLENNKCSDFVDRHPFKLWTEAFTITDNNEDPKYLFNPGTKRLYKFDSIKETSSEEEIFEGNRKNNGDIEYLFQFYNGGTDTTEMAEELLKQKNW